MKHPPAPLLQTEKDSTRMPEISTRNCVFVSTFPLLFHPICHSEDMAQFRSLIQSVTTKTVKCFLAQTSSWGHGAQIRVDTMKLDVSALSGTDI